MRLQLRKYCVTIGQFGRKNMCVLSHVRRSDEMPLADGPRQRHRRVHERERRRRGRCARRRGDVPLRRRVLTVSAQRGLLPRLDVDRRHKPEVQT